MSQQTGTHKKRKKEKKEVEKKGGKEARLKLKRIRPELNKKKGIRLFRCKLLLQTNHGLYCYGPTSNGLCWALGQTSDSKMESRMRLTTM